MRSNVNVAIEPKVSVFYVVYVVSFAMGGQYLCTNVPNEERKGNRFNFSSQCHFSSKAYTLNRIAEKLLYIYIYIHTYIFT